MILPCRHPLDQLQGTNPLYYCINNNNLMHTHGPIHPILPTTHLHKQCHLPLDATLANPQRTKPTTLTIKDHIHPQFMPDQPQGDPRRAPPWHSLKVSLPISLSPDLRPAVLPSMLTLLRQEHLHCLPVLHRLLLPLTPHHLQDNRSLNQHRQTKLSMPRISTLSFQPPARRGRLNLHPYQTNIVLLPSQSISKSFTSHLLLTEIMSQPHPTSASIQLHPLNLSIHHYPRAFLRPWHKPHRRCSKRVLVRPWLLAQITRLLIFLTASFPNLAFSPHGEDPENHQNRDEDWSYPSHRSPESTSTAGSAGDDWATHSPDSSRRPASSIDVRSPDELAVHDQPPLRRNVSEVNVGWTPELASQSSFQPLQPLGSPPISPNASFSGTPFGALSSPPQPPHRHSPAPPFASPAQAPPPSLQSPSVVTSPISPSTVPPAPTRQASSGAFDYKPSSSMTGLADTSIDSSAADRDPAIRAPYPVAAFGFGGKLFTSFPSPANNGFYGERGVAVKIQDLHDVIPDSTLEEFPGPLFSPKSSAAKLKEDVMHWLHTRVEAAEKEKGYSKSLGREAQTQSASDHCTLLRILTILIQHDGKLIGSYVWKYGSNARSLMVEQIRG